MRISGMSSMTSNSIQGFGGLASGLDRDSLIEGMTQGTLAKINKQKQKKMMLQWEQTAIRNITDKLTSFGDKFISTYSSGTNLFSDSLWGRNQITALGANSKYISVSGSASTADTISILGVKKLAEKAQLTSGSAVSDGALVTGEIDFVKPQEIQNLEGKTLTFTYDAKEYTVTLPAGDGTKYDTVDNVATALNTALSKVEIEGGKKLSDVVNVTAAGDKLTFKDNSNSGKELKLTGGTAVEHLGFKKEADGTFKAVDFKGGQAVSAEAITKTDLITEKTFAQQMAGKSMTFNYNGVSKTVKMPGEAEMQNLKTPEAFAKMMQDQLNEAFGPNRIKVNFTSNSSNPDAGSLSFQTVKMEGGGQTVADSSSILSISSADEGILGEKGALKVAHGESNRLNLSAKITESGSNGAKALSEWFAQNPNMNFSFTIHDGLKEHTIEITKDDTMQSVMDKINKDTKVQISYQSTADKFVITSKYDGASGSFQFKAEPSGSGVLQGLFGNNIQTKAEGQDAVLTVRYAGSKETVDIVRDSNTFKMDGMSITLKGEFGYVNGQLDQNAEAVTLDAKVDNDKVVTAVKDFVKGLNEIIELVNSEVRTKPSRDYHPLTDEQKKEMSESEIEAWEKEAKKGLLFNDNDIKGLSSDLRFVVGLGDLQELEKIGITLSSTASDNGKLSLDENKFKAALAADPDGVKKLFAKEEQKDSTGKVVQSDGIAANLKRVLDKYAKTLGEPKGILIERAGSVKSPASMNRNELHKAMEQIDKRISGLQASLKREQDRYVRQFTALESLIAQMNSQSGMLSQFTGGF